jgi:hypothetical protein
MREMSEVTRMAAMKSDPIFTPSGRSRTFAAVVYAKTNAITPKAIAARRARPCQTAMVTATAAEVIRTRTPVA